MSNTNLPQWKCHKVVRAAKILALVSEDSQAAGLRLDSPLHGSEVTPVIVVGQPWLLKHKPEIGGYYVVYEDGYTSYSPAEAFEAGYKRLPDGIDKLLPHQQRVVIEAAELAGRIEKLAEFIGGDIFKGLQGEECNDLVSQLYAMGEVAECLHRRIARFKA